MIIEIVQDNGTKTTFEDVERYEINSRARLLMLIRKEKVAYFNLDFIKAFNKRE